MNLRIPIGWILFLILGAVGCSSSRKETAGVPLEPPSRDRIARGTGARTKDGSHGRVRPDGGSPLSGASVHGLPNAPDISDSLAAATEARLQSVEEIFDYPVVVNPRVLAWIDFYLGRGRSFFDASLMRSGRYLAAARRIFAEEGVPQDLVFLGHVESGFRHDARSHARAVGLWQFMKGTARLYDLRCDGYVDERLDPEKATRAAARHLRDLYAHYEDWYLALAAYNAGSGGVDRAIRTAGTRDFWQIARTRHLVNETRNFVPAILAATILAKSPGAYGFTEETEAALEYETVPVAAPTDLRVVAECAGVPAGMVEELNPCVLMMQTPPGSAPFEVRVPKGRGEPCARALEKIPADKRLVFHHHRVRAGETLGRLAAKYGTSVSAIQEANGMGRRTTIYLGRTLRIPARSVPAPGRVASGESVRHKVRRGESLSAIARRYGIGVEKIRAANAIEDPGRIRSGDVLTIPGGAPPPQDAAPAYAGGAAEPDGDWTASYPTIANTRDSLGRVSSTAHIVEDARVAIESEPEEPPAMKPQVHVVRRGESAWKIAKRYGVKVADILLWNNLRKGATLYPGQRLRVG
jgi:membrane-bound lytic murein transglycosylase D